MTTVVFDPSAFKVRYPEFVAASNPLLQAYFDEATIYLPNGDCSQIQNLARRKTFLWMLTAHIAALNGGAAGGGSVAAVGRLSSATEGTVSVGYELNTSGGAIPPWLAQTQYGLAYWQASANKRGFRYVSQPTRWR